LGTSRPAGFQTSIGLGESGGGEPECVDALKETELNFLLWPDAKLDGLVVQRPIAACDRRLRTRASDSVADPEVLGVDAEFC